MKVVAAAHFSAKYSITIEGCGLYLLQEDKFGIFSKGRAGCECMHALPNLIRIEMTTFPFHA